MTSHKDMPEIWASPQLKWNFDFTVAAEIEANYCKSSRRINLDMDYRGQYERVM